MPLRLLSGSKIHLRLLPVACAALFFCSVASAGDAPVRVAIVGLEHGHVGGFITRVLARQDVQLVGVVEARRELRERDARQYKLNPALMFARMEDLMAATKVDAVATFTNTFDHLKVVESCAALKIPVMMEKPLAVNMTHARAMAAAAKRSGIHVIVNYETTWYAGNHHAYAAIHQDKAIGEIRRIIVNDGHSGRGDTAPRPEFSQWLKDPASGGGALLDFACYGADLVTWLMRNERPLSVVATTQRLQPLKYLHVEDEATLVLTYPKAVALIQASWNWPFARKDMEVYGQRGSILVPQKDIVRLRVGTAEERVLTPAPLKAPHGDSISYLAEIARGRLQPEGLSSLEVNLIATEILDAAAESARTGKRVDLLPSKL
ncbi:MAG: Glucose--fructose oxidoreductase precursor [Verrucomicrobiota bacterium]|jgi:predicted dehydrogenase